MTSRLSRAWIFAAAALVITAAGCAQSGGIRGVGGAYNHPVVGERLVYLTGIDGYLYAFDKATGSIDQPGWRAPVGKGKKLKPLVAGPVLARLPGAEARSGDGSGQDRQMVVVASEDGNVYAFDARDGEQLWQFPAGDKVWSTPVIRDGVVYFGSQDHNIYAIYLADGKKKWQFKTGAAVAGRPLLFGDLVVAGSFDRKLYGISADDGSLRWSFEGDNWFWAGPVADEGSIFAPSMDGNVYALDRDGKLRWKHDMGSPIVSTPVLHSRGLVVIGKDAKLSLLNTRPAEAGTARELTSPLFVRDAEVKAPLFIKGDSVFIGAQDSTVTRIDIKVKGAGNVSFNQAWCFNTKEERAECR
jgi:outer membrane protein assembly factor BamB